MPTRNNACGASSITTQEGYLSYTYSQTTIPRSLNPFAFSFYGLVVARCLLSTYLEIGMELVWEVHGRLHLVLAI